MFDGKWALTKYQDQSLNPLLQSFKYGGHALTHLTEFCARDSSPDLPVIPTQLINEVCIVLAEMYPAQLVTLDNI